MLHIIYLYIICLHFIVLYAYVCTHVSVHMHACALSIKCMYVSGIKESEKERAQFLCVDIV